MTGTVKRKPVRYNADNDEWVLVIESENKDGTWSLFAQYNIARKKVK